LHIFTKMNELNNHRKISEIDEMKRNFYLGRYADTRKELESWRKYYAKSRDNAIRFGATLQEFQEKKLPRTLKQKNCYTIF
jgi:benzoyl-CoA reductase/2-hydroxyglutaryl-CoA dehydratase subunit BcrC/BadD/HgdB